MTRWLRSLLPPLLVALGLPVALLVAPAAAIAGDPCYHGFDMPTMTVSTATQVKAMPCAFAPTVTYVPTGATVTWFSGNGESHLITGANQEWGSRDVELEPNGSVSYTFDRPGVYPYACALHRGMVGAVVVGAETAGLVAPTEDGPSGPGAAGTTGAAEPTSTVAADGVRVGIAAIAGALIALAIAWIVRGLRRPVAVKEIG